MGLREFIERLPITNREEIVAVCPHCGIEVQKAINIDQDGDRLVPGAWNICAHCTGVSIVTKINDTPSGKVIINRRIDKEDLGHLYEYFFNDFVILFETKSNILKVNGGATSDENLKYIFGQIKSRRLEDNRSAKKIVYSILLSSLVEIVDD